MQEETDKTLDSALKGLTELLSDPEQVERLTKERVKRADKRRKERQQKRYNEIKDMQKLEELNNHVNQLDKDLKEHVETCNDCRTNEAGQTFHCHQYGRMQEIGQTYIDQLEGAERNEAYKLLRQPLNNHQIAGLVALLFNYDCINGVLYQNNKPLNIELKNMQQILAHHQEHHQRIGRFLFLEESKYLLEHNVYDKMMNRK